MSTFDLKKFPTSTVYWTTEPTCVLFLSKRAIGVKYFSYFYLFLEQGVTAVWDIWACCPATQG